MSPYDTLDYATDQSDLGGMSSGGGGGAKAERIVAPALAAGPKPLRAMLPRGAACDLCRSRKVKCDGLRPVCSQCQKSSRANHNHSIAEGNGGEIRCVYEGGAHARLTATGGGGNANKKKAAPGSGAKKVAVGGKRKRPSKIEQDLDDDDDDGESAAGSNEGDEDGSGDGSFDSQGPEKKRASLGNNVVGYAAAHNGAIRGAATKAKPAPSTMAGGARKKQAGPGPGQRVEILIDRISELERRLRQQSQPGPLSIHTHVRASASPPFYPASTSASEPLSSHSSHSLRRGLSFSGVAEEPTSKEIAAAWTPESSVRRTLVVEGMHHSHNGGGGPSSSSMGGGGGSSGMGNGLAMGGMGMSGMGGGNGNGGGGGGANLGSYASFIPQQHQQPQHQHHQHQPQQHANSYSMPSNDGAYDFGAPPSAGMGYSMSRSGSIPGISSFGGTPLSNSASGGVLPMYPPTASFPHNNGNYTHLLGYSPSLASFGPPSSSYFPQPPQNQGYGVGGLPISPPVDDSSLLQLLYPSGPSRSWPASLPPKSVTLHLLSTFFARASVPASVINQSRLFESLLEGSDKRFPDEGLLHAICAHAVGFVCVDTLGEMDGSDGNPWNTGLAGGGGKKKYWEGSKGPREYHCAKAREEIEKGVTRQGNLFQVLQTTILLCYIAYQTASFTELWLLSGTATRLCTPLGLNHLPSWDFVSNSVARKSVAKSNWGQRLRREGQGPNSRGGLLDEPQDWEEYDERVKTFWAAFSIDRHASASTDWSTSIDELDISTHLPASAPAPASSLSLRSASFLSEMAQPAGSLGLYIKAVVLLGRVVNYLQRLPRYEALPEGETCQSIRSNIKASPAFQKIDAALSKFRASTSANFFDAGNLIDGHLASAYALPHAASILLHEPFCDTEDRSPTSSIARCLTSAKCVVNSTYVLYQSSNDLSGIDPFLPYCWSVVGRALVRDSAVKKLWGETESSQFSKELAEHCLMFTSGKNDKVADLPVAAVMTRVLRDLLDNPERCLPPMDASAECRFTASP